MSPYHYTLRQREHNKLWYIVRIDMQTKEERELEPHFESQTLAWKVVETLSYCTEIAYVAGKE